MIILFTCQAFFVKMAHVPHAGKISEIKVMEDISLGFDLTAVKLQILYHWKQYSRIMMKNRVFAKFSLPLNLSCETKNIPT